MHASKEPLKQLSGRLAAIATYWNPHMDDFHLLDPDLDSEIFQKELDLMSQLGDIDLPPCTVKKLVEGKPAGLSAGADNIPKKTLVCEGFSLTNKLVYFISYNYCKITEEF